jgi:hypothetical protein
MAHRAEIPLEWIKNMCVYANMHACMLASVILLLIDSIKKKNSYYFSFRATERYTWP